MTASAVAFDPLALHTVPKRNGKCRTYVAGSAAFLKHWSSGAIQVYFASDNEVF